MLLRIPNHWLSDLAFALLVTLLTYIAFSNLSHHLFEIDDVRYIQDAAKTHDNFSYFFARDKSLPGRPVTELAFAIIQTLANNNPFVYHTVLIILHSLAAYTLMLTLRHVGADAEISFVGALFFLIHVGHIRVIQWISCLAYPLALIAIFLALMAYHSYLTKHHKIQYILAIFLFLISGLSHPATLILALFFAGYAYKYQQLLTVWPFFILSLIIPSFLYMLYPHMPQAYLADQFTGAQWFLNLFFFFGALFTRAIWLPAHLGWQMEEFLVGLFIILPIAIFWRKRSHNTNHWFIFALLMLIPFLNMPTEETYSRQLYFSSAGASFSMAYFLRYGITRLPSKIYIQQLVWVSCLIFCIMLSIFSLYRAEAQAFYNSGWYFFSQQQDAPNKEMKNNLQQLGRNNFLQAIERDPRYLPQIALRGLYFGEIFPAQIAKNTNLVKHQYLTNLYEYLKVPTPNRWQILQDLLSKNAALRPFHIQASSHIGNHYLSLNHPQEAFFFFQNAQQMTPHDPKLLVGMGRALTNQNQIQKAESAYLKALAIDAENLDAHQAHLDLQLQQKQFSKAEKTAQKAIKQSPRNAQLYYYLGITLANQNEHIRAIEAFEKAHTLGFHIQTLRNTICETYIHWGTQTLHQNQKQTARIYFHHALKLRPQDEALKRILQQIAQP